MHHQPLTPHNNSIIFRLLSYNGSIRDLPPQDRYKLLFQNQNSVSSESKAFSSRKDVISIKHPRNLCMNCGREITDRETSPERLDSLSSISVQIIEALEHANRSRTTSERDVDGKAIEKKVSTRIKSFIATSTLITKVKAENIQRKINIHHPHQNQNLSCDDYPTKVLTRFETDGKISTIRIILV